MLKTSTKTVFLLVLVHHCQLKPGLFYLKTITILNYIYTRDYMHLEVIKP